MTPIELLTAASKHAQDYRLNAKESIIRNKHMNELHKIQTIDLPQEYIDALLVDFINTLAMEYGIDYGMYTHDLKLKLS